MASEGQQQASQLTPTDEMLLAFAREGLRDAEIAVRLSIPISSVKARFDALERRAHLRGRQALATWDPATEEAEVVSPPPAPQPMPASPRSRSGIVISSLGLAAITAVVAFFAMNGPDDEIAPAPLPAVPAPVPGAALSELELLQSALAYRPDPPSLQFGTPVRVDATFSIIVKAQDGDRRAIGLDRIYVPPGRQDAVREPLFRVPAGWELTTAGASFGGGHLAVISARDGEANLVTSRDGGITWTQAAAVAPGTQVAFVSASMLVLADPYHLGWRSFDGEALSAPIAAPPGTTGPPVATDASGALLWKSAGASLVGPDGRAHLNLSHPDLHVERLNAYAALSVNGLALVLWSNPDGVFTSLATEDGSLITTFFSPPWSPAGPASTLRVVGNDCPAAYPETEAPGLPCQAVLFHPGTGTLHPIVDPLLQTDQFDPTPIVASQAGPFALVSPGATCLPLYASPSASSGSESCATPGQLLTLAYPGDLDAAGPIDPHFVREDGRTLVHVYDTHGVARWVDAAAVALGFVPPFP